MESGNFHFLLVLPAKLNDTLTLVASACNVSKSGFIRAAILERLSNIDTQNGMKGKASTPRYYVSRIYKCLQAIVRAAYESEEFWLLVQFVCGVEALYLISQWVRP